MSVVIETTLGDITVDLFIEDRPKACLNFLKLCKIKYYNYNLFHTISRGFIAQTGDPTGSRGGGESIFGVIDGPSKRYFEAETKPRIKHTSPGLISFVGTDCDDGRSKITGEKTIMIGSQFFLTLGEDLTYLDDKHCVFGSVEEGIETLEILNEVICDTDDRPYQDVRITHIVVLDDPFPDPDQLCVPSRSPSPSAERLAGGRIAPDEEINETSGKTAQEIAEMTAEQEAKARATILEMIGDIPDAEIAPPENVLFVCKLNPVTTDDDLEIIFSRFGVIKSCEVIRDRKTGDSLQYAFVEFKEQKSCEDAYFKMNNVLIDERRIHVDFSQSVSKVRWMGKGRGVTYYDENGKSKRSDARNDIGRGDYKLKQNNERRSSRSPSPSRKNRNQTSKHWKDRNRDDRRRNRSRSKPKDEYRNRRRHDYDDRNLYTSRRRSADRNKRNYDRPSKNDSYSSRKRRDQEKNKRDEHREKRTRTRRSRSKKRSSSSSDSDSN